MPILSLPAAVMAQSLPAFTTDTSPAELGGSPNRASSIAFPAASSIATSASQGLGPVPGSVSAPFSDLLTEAVGQVDQLEKQARSTVEGLMTGKGVDVHQAMIATEKAEMGFELMLSIRSKALSAYQQIMGMQF